MLELKILVIMEDMVVFIIKMMKDFKLYVSLDEVLSIKIFYMMQCSFIVVKYLPQFTYNT